MSSFAIFGTALDRCTGSACALISAGVYLYTTRGRAGEGKAGAAAAAAAAAGAASKKRE